MSKYSDIRMTAGGKLHLRRAVEMGPRLQGHQGFSQRLHVESIVRIPVAVGHLSILGHDASDSSREP
jgi:hypothetical protein